VGPSMTRGAALMSSNGGRSLPGSPSGNSHEARCRPGCCQTKTALLPAPFCRTYAWNRPTDPLWLCWRGKPWLAIRWRRYAASKPSQLESIGMTINFRPAAITHRDIAASALLIACRLAAMAAWMRWRAGSYFAAPTYPRGAAIARRRGPSASTASGCCD
jgi:hypothetical protein